MTKSQFLLPVCVLLCGCDQIDDVEAIIDVVNDAATLPNAGSPAPIVTSSGEPVAPTGGTGGGGGTGGSSEPTNAPLRIVLFGDSITQGPCTSQLLWQNLREAGASNIDMIGTWHNDRDCGVTDADRDNEGHTGYLATDMVDNGQHAEELVTWSEQDKADVLVMHLGTNDFWHRDLDPTIVLDAYTKILAAFRKVQPNVTVFVAQIIPTTSVACPQCSPRARQLNKQIPAWAARESNDASPIYVVDQYTGFDPETDTVDGAHPNKQGSVKMAAKWSAALLDRLTL